MTSQLIFTSKEPIFTEKSSYVKLIQLKWYYHYYYYYYYYYYCYCYYYYYYYWGLRGGAVG